MKAVECAATWAPRARYLPSPAELASGKARVASEVWRDPVVAWRQVPDPTPAPGEVVLRVRRCGVCGSDTHLTEPDADGYVRFSGPTRLPGVIGHEYVGEIVAVGDGVRDLRVGTLVAAEGMLYCGLCEACRRGAFNQCPRLEMVGFSAPGAYAELIASHERHLWSLDGVAERLGSAELALDRGALIEPIACAYNGIYVVAGGMAPGAHVVVHGCGPIGLGAVALARLGGAASILAIDVVPERLEIARRLGADLVWDARAVAVVDQIAGILDATRGWGADLHVEAAGAARQTVPVIEATLAPGGTMVYLGRTGERAPMELDRLVTGAARVVGARGHAGGGCFPSLIRLLERGLLDPTPMITAKLPMSSALDALERSRSRTDGKILLAQ